jgi:predicted dehydrogenase
MKPKINIGQIGVGYWGPNLLRNLVANKTCNVKTVIDLVEDRRDFVRSLYPAIHVSDDASEVINDPDIDAVVIATPVASHFDLALRSIENSKHVLVEKPMATSEGEIEEIDRLSSEKNLVVMVGHTFLYNSAVRYVKNRIDSGDLGDIRYIYSQRVNLGRIRHDVDALWNFAPHDISIIQYWLGNPTPVSVVKRGIDFIQNGVDDVVFMNIIYQSNIMANIHVSWLDPHKIRKMTVVGSKKMVVYDDIAENKVTIYDKGIERMATLSENMDFDNPDFFKFNHRSGDVLLPKIEFEEPLKVEIEHFIDCIKTGEKCLTGPDHAKEVVRILNYSSKISQF